MDKTPDHLKHAALTERIIKIFYQVYNELGFGFLEAVIENAMAIALIEAGIKVVEQAPIPEDFRGGRWATIAAICSSRTRSSWRLKAVKAITPEHQAKALHYLRATEIEVVRILNFGERPDFKRQVFDNDRKKLRGAADTHG